MMLVELDKYGGFLSNKYTVLFIICVSMRVRLLYSKQGRSEA